MFDSRADIDAPEKGFHHEKGVTYFSKPHHILHPDHRHVVLGPL